jgi:hypothetical protein
MTTRNTKKTAALAGTAVALLIATPAFARGGGGGHGGGGHFSGGHSSGGYSGGHSGGTSHATPHYSAPSHGSFAGTHASPMHGPSVGDRHGYIGGGRGAFVAGGRVPYFYGGPHGRVWWGPHYGWRVPAYWGGYYGPYLGYWGVSFWVTDWVMLDYLAAEEARRHAYGAPPVTSAPIAVDVRDELRAQIAELLLTPTPPTSSSADASNTLGVSDVRVARALAAAHHVFVVSQPVTVTDRTNGGTCALSQGDLLRTSAPIPSGQSFADVHVAGSKGGSCAPGVVAAIPIIHLVQFEEALIDRVARGAAAAKATEAEAESAPPAPSETAPRENAPTPEPGY